MEAIKKYSYLLEERFLDKAYDRAQQFFNGILTPMRMVFVISCCIYHLSGEMERMFLVLREPVAMARIRAKDRQRAGLPPAEEAPQGVQQPQAQAPPAQAPAPSSIQHQAQVAQVKDVDVD